ncbi:MAG: VOC family protein [Pseudomonadota bacterium]
MHLDHVVIAAERLEKGRAWVAERLGVAPDPGGKHPALGTHNCLLSLGPEIYLEVISIDPEGVRPAFARCFGLDTFSGPPRLVAWMARVGHLEQALQAAPDGAGQIHPLSRGDLRWLMAIPESGSAPFDGIYPGLIEWQSNLLPPRRLPDRGLRLDRLTLTHPRAGALRAALKGLDEPRVEVLSGSAPGISAGLRLTDGTAASL